MGHIEIFAEMKLPTLSNSYGLDLSSPKLRKAALDWIEDTGCDHAVTLVFNRSIPLEAAIKRLSKWLYELEHHIRKCRPHRLPRSARIRAYAVAEHLNSNIHFHLAIKLIDGRDVHPANLPGVLIEAERLWLASTPGGSFEAKRLFDARGWARYLTKDCWKGSELILGETFHSTY
jgi:hypothetical protein